MAKVDLPFAAFLAADDATTAVLKGHAQRITGTPSGEGWQCEVSSERAHFRFAHLADRERFVSFVWDVEHIRAEISP